jgi:ATP-binding cassette, subfamily B, multidrug efflux pump
MEEKENKKKTRRNFPDFTVIRRIFTYVKPYKSKFFLALIIVITLSGLSISRPLMIQEAIDAYILKGDSSGLKMITLLLIGIILTEALLQLTNIYLSSLLGMSIVKDLRNQVFRHLLKMRNKYYDNTPIGTLVTRSVSDIESLGEVFAEGFIVIFGDILTLCVFIVVMFYNDWRLALLSLATVPVLIFATIIFKNGVKTSFNAVRNAVSALNTFVQEHLTGMKIVQVFNKEEESFEKFREINRQHKKANIRSIWYYSVFFPVVEILSSVSLGLVIWFGGAGGGITGGKIVFFTMIIHMFFRPIRMLADRINTLQMGLVSSERVFKVLDTDEKISDTGKIHPQSIIGEIEFKNVWFAYNEEEWVLKDVSFKVRAGETFAIVGATGAGKSSIINILNRYYEYSKGEILIDGIDLREYSQDFLHRAIGTVMQDVFLFSDSVKNNITLFDDNIPLPVVEVAAKEIGADFFIDQLPNRYEFNIRERGNTLSVGQRQMISFLRACVNNPSVLVLDEATSSIDSETEQLIQKATEKITAGRTSVVIAHRLSTIQKADRIIVMDKGEIIEEGGLKALLKKGGVFKKLYDLQFEQAPVD